ncbi:MAG: DUF924 domain-containing protein [Kaiparowitsia implicata GSE-PSE-MK54-09C]|nr:DUF924 domain-containing protein [Kaiparowitsia implicata GSE-PSE-MK54-09C]
MSYPPQPPYAQVLQFWFGDDPAADGIYEQRRSLWFRKSAETDAVIRDRFLSLHEQAAQSHLDDWNASAGGSLALVLLLDQFPRNMFRDTPRAFATDDQARAIAQHTITHGLEQFLTPSERLFLYLPLEHSENLAHQHQAVDLIRPLVDLDPKLADAYDYALRHRDVIAQFGRFPHRNRILNRETTIAEAEFLKQPGSSF